MNTNAYQDRKSSYRLSKAITMRIRGSACFDFDLYRSRSPDLAGLVDNDQLWEHFLRDGQFEGRAFRQVFRPVLNNIAALVPATTSLYQHAISTTVRCKICLDGNVYQSSLWGL